MANILNNKKGQTSLEYLMLMALTFVMSYIIITGPLAHFTKLTLATIRGGIHNMVRNGDWSPGELLETGESGHPGDPNRFRPVHL